MLKNATLALCLAAATLGRPAVAGEHRGGEAMPRLDHVFLIVMENQTASGILGNPRAPFLNRYAREANQATQYFAIGHPSLPNYLHMVGGSNFGVPADESPKWHDDPSSGGRRVRPLTGSGMDLPTPASLTGATGGKDIPAKPYTAMTIADQLHAAGRTWKSYQESLPASGADRVDSADGGRYAVKHNPFVYFASVQKNDPPGNGLSNIVGFDGPHGLYADLRAGQVPNFSFIVPNQCHDMHGLGDAGPLCANRASLIEMGDATVKTLVAAIKASPAWRKGRNAIVVTWDENDFSNAPNVVVMIVDTNYGPHGVQSGTPYNHHSLLGTLEAGFGLACLNHACDASVRVMADLFAPR